MELQSRGIKAGSYHADLSARERSRVHRAWIENKIHVSINHVTKVCDESKSIINMYMYVNVHGHVK